MHPEIFLRSAQSANITGSTTPPHDDEAEQGVLGCALLSPDKLPEIISALKGNLAFYDLRHQCIFSTLRTMYNAGQAIDLITVQAWLKEGAQLEQIGGIPYLAQLQDAVPSAANLRYYLEIVREHFDRRRLAQSCQTALSRLHDPAATFADLKAMVQADFIEVFSGHANADLPEITDAAAFVAEAIKPPPELIAGILHKGSKLALGGSSKSFKTWNLLDLALSVATGAAWLGRATEQGKVLFVNFEIQPHSWQRRLIAVAQAKGITLQPGQIHLWNLRGHAADFRKLIPKIIERCRTESFALIILDPIYKLYGSTDENAAGDVAALLNEIERLTTETGAAVAFGAHFAKGNASAKEAIDRISGSGVFARDPDSLLIFTKHEADEAFTVQPILRDFPPVQPFAVRWQFPLMRLADDLDPAKLKKAGGRKPEHSPADLLELLPTGGLENKAWQESAEENGISKRTFFRLRKALANDRKIHLSTVTNQWQPILKK